MSGTDWDAHRGGKRAAKSQAKEKIDPADRDGEFFSLVPYVVQDCPAYFELSHTARSFLLEVVRRCNAYNNGKIELPASYLQSRGWRTPNVVIRAKTELIEFGFLFETRKGGYPKTTSLFAITWKPLAKDKRYDAGVEAAFQRGAYLRVDATRIRAELDERAAKKRSESKARAVIEKIKASNISEIAQEHKKPAPDLSPR